MLLLLITFGCNALFFLPKAEKCSSAISARRLVCGRRTNIFIYEYVKILLFVQVRLYCVYALMKNVRSSTYLCCFCRFPSLSVSSVPRFVQLKSFEQWAETLQMDFLRSHFQHHFSHSPNFRANIYAHTLAWSLVLFTLNKYRSTLHGSSTSVAAKSISAIEFLLTECIESMSAQSKRQKVYFQYIIVSERKGIEKNKNGDLISNDWLGNWINDKIRSRDTNTCERDIVHFQVPSECIAISSFFSVRHFHIHSHSHNVKEVMIEGTIACILSLAQKRTKSNENAFYHIYLISFRSSFPHFTLIGKCLNRRKQQHICR